MRSREPGCLSRDYSVTRPWGERSFHADDPFANGPCFVDERTVFTGR